MGHICWLLILLGRSNRVNWKCPFSKQRKWLSSNFINFWDTNKIPIKINKPKFLQFTIAKGVLCSVRTNWQMEISELKNSNKLTFEETSEKIKKLREFGFPVYSICWSERYAGVLVLTTQLSLWHVWPTHRFLE